MSLLDAIGFSEPEDKKTKKDDSTPQGAIKAPRKKKAAGKPADPAPLATASEHPVLDQVQSAAPAPANAEPAEPSTGGTSEITAASAATVQLDEKREPDAETGALEIRPDGPLPLDKYLCFALYSANHAMHGVYKALLKEIGLTYPQFLAMTVLWDTNNVPVGAITQKLQLDTNTLTPLLKRLEAMELLTRTRSTRDERQVILKLTRKGRALQKKTEHFAHCIFTSTGLSLEEITGLQAKIMKLRDNLRATETG